MDAVVLLKALILGVVEGLTEFLPISSTGHLIIASELLGFHDEKGKVFEIVIQTGAMLAVVWEYRARFARALTGITRDPVAQRFVINLVVAFIPAAILGLAFGSVIKAHLFHAVPVALAFIVGGLIILWVERRQRRPRVTSVDEMTWMDALKVGLAQSIALIPGTSRAGATIIGGMALEHLDRDREFLTRGGVFSNDMIDAYIDLKMEEVTLFRMTTHPLEFQLYYSL